MGRWAQARRRGGGVSAGFPLPVPSAGEWSFTNDGDGNWQLVYDVDPPGVTFGNFEVYEDDTVRAIGDATATEPQVDAAEEGHTYKARLRWKALSGEILSDWSAFQTAVF